MMNRNGETRGRSHPLLVLRTDSTRDSSLGRIDGSRSTVPNMRFRKQSERKRANCRDFAACSTKGTCGAKRYTLAAAGDEVGTRPEKGVAQMVKSWFPSEEQE